MVVVTEAQLRRVLALGGRCVTAGYLARPAWQGLLAAALKGPQTVIALRVLVSSLCGTVGDHSALADELRRADEDLRASLRVPRHRAVTPCSPTESHG